MEERPRKDHNKRQKMKRRETVEVKMDYVPVKEGYVPPFVSYFPTGFDPVAKSEGAGGEEDEEESTTALRDIRAYRGSDKLKAKQHQLVMSTSQGQVDFVGLNYMAEAAAWQPCSYVLGVFDKEKGSLKLAPLAGEKIFRMEPRVRGVNYDQDAKPAGVAPEEVQTWEMGFLKRRQLTETFGNQKSRARALQAERGVVKEEALGDAEQMETLFQEAGQNEALLTTDQVLQQANMSVSRNVPPHDVTAMTPGGAYPLEKLITQEEWEALDVKEIRVAAKKSAAEEALRQSHTYPNFVLSRLKRIRVENDKEGNNRRAHILVYLRHLLTFNNASASLIRKAATDPLGNPGLLSGHGKPFDLADELGIPGVVVARFLKQFTSEAFSTDNRSGGRQKGKDHRDLLVSYVLVLGLAIDDFRTDPFDIAVELKMTLSQLRPHYQELGCKFERCSAVERQALGDSMQNLQGKWRVTLPVPLQFPQVVTSRGRSRTGQ